MTAQEQLQQIRAKMDHHKARAYDLKNQLEFEENQIIGLYGASQVAEQLAADAKSKEPPGSDQG